jgi:hypothetical protein
MSHRLLLTFLIMYVGCSILGAIMQGGGGIASTVLAEDISANATFIPAESTSLFADKDIITIGEEKILYTSLNTTGFNVYTRGYGDTTATAHSEDSRIYTQEAGVINNALGYNLAVEAETGGTYGVITIPIKFFTTTLPHLIMLNVNFLKIPELSIIAIFWMVSGIALLVVLAIQIAPIAVSLITGIFGLIRR